MIESSLLLCFIVSLLCDYIASGKLEKDPLYIYVVLPEFVPVPSIFELLIPIFFLGSKSSIPKCGASLLTEMLLEVLLTMLPLRSSRT